MRSTRGVFVPVKLALHCVRPEPTRVECLTFYLAGHDNIAKACQS